VCVDLIRKRVPVPYSPLTIAGVKE
jgi:hypothetical protein